MRCVFEDSSIPVYVRLASLLQEQITAGELRPGAAVPSEVYLASHYGVSRQTARFAVRLLREGGWIVTYRARGSVVLPVPDPRVILAGPGAVVRARLALPGDPPGGDVMLLVTRPGAGTEVIPAPRAVIRVTGRNENG